MSTKILVIIDPQLDSQPAFERAIELAEQVEVSLHVVLFTDGDGKELSNLDLSKGEESKAGQNFVRQCQAWLEELVGPYLEKGIEITTAVQAFRRLYEEVIRVATARDASFIFKPMRHHSLMRRTFYTSTDWNLIRTCPFPLLLVNDARPMKGRDILAAVNVSDRDSDHDELNRIILSQAVTVSKLFDSRVQVVNALPMPTIPLGYSATEPTGHHLIRGMEDDHRSGAIALASQFDIPEDCVTVIEGQPEIVVNRVAEQTDAGVIILGTVARSGLSGLFVGNTAERVLEESQSDVLVLKQADFTSPI
jgi:universal stress protein E